MKRVHVCLLIFAACCLGCTHRLDSQTLHPVDRFFIFARNWPTEEVELILKRDHGATTVILFRPARDKRPRILLDSIGPVRNDPDIVREMFASFDVWALNAPNAPGAACTTRNGTRKCVPKWKDYSVAMRVERGGEVRVQRYTGLEKKKGNPSARALGDFVLAWARQVESRRRPR